MILEFTVPGDAVPFGSKNTRFVRAGKMVGGQRKTDKALAWQEAVSWSASAAMAGRPLFEGPLHVGIFCVFALPASRYRKREPRPAGWKITKPDGDKITRLVMDAMEGIVYPHDAQVASHELVKITGAQGEPGRTEIFVAPLEDPPKSLDGRARGV